MKRFLQESGRRFTQIVAFCVATMLCFYITMVYAAQIDSAPNHTQSSIDSLRAMYLSPQEQWERAFVDDGVEYREIGALPKTPPYPASNPYTKEKEELGKALFEDPRLSRSNQIACASCHERQLGFSDGKSVSHGHDRQLGARNAPSVVMAAFGREQFWDGRAKDLESQALMPIADPREMAYSPEEAAQKLSKIPEYRAKFQEAFGTDEITSERIALAIATYERALMPKNSRFDRFMRGESKALSDKEVLGLHLFRTKGRCMNCHNGVEFSNQSYHNLGLTYFGRKFEDLGRYMVTKNAEDVGKFKTPSLRQVAKSAPYMHNGLFPHLRGVLNAYNGGMFHPTLSDSQKAQLSKERQELAQYLKTDSLLQPLHLSPEELDALEAFLRTL